MRSLTRGQVIINFTEPFNLNVTGEVFRILFTTCLPNVSTWLIGSEKKTTHTIKVIRYRGFPNSKMPLARTATWPEDQLAIQIFNWPDFFSISWPLRIWVHWRQPHYIDHILLWRHIFIALHHICIIWYIPVNKQSILEKPLTSNSQHYLVGVGERGG